MTLEQIIEKAREDLPYASDFEMPDIRIPVQNFIPLVEPLTAPTEYDRPVYIVHFRKQYISHIVVGWEFVELVNGI
jgi:hypothetical protein